MKGTKLLREMADSKDRAGYIQDDQGSSGHLRKQRSAKK